MKNVENYMIEETLSDGITIMTANFHLIVLGIPLTPAQVKLKVSIDKSLTEPTFVTSGQL